LKLKERAKAEEKSISGLAAEGVTAFLAGWVEKPKPTSLFQSVKKQEKVRRIQAG
jgi:hypothetical protein